MLKYVLFSHLFIFFFTSYLMPSLFKNKKSATYCTVEKNFFFYECVLELNFATINGLENLVVKIVVP
jgi:hypothetical protein